MCSPQPFWGRVVAERGLGPKPIPQGRLTAPLLAGAIQVAATDPAMAQRAAALGAQIRAEDGVGNAMAILERMLAVQPRAAQRTASQEHAL